MRKANTNDLFALARFVKKLDLKKEINDYIKNNGTSGKSAEEIGFDFFLEIIMKATSENMQKEIYKLLSAPFECEQEEVGTLEITELFKKIEECFDLKTVVNFIKRVNI